MVFESLCQDDCTGIGEIGLRRPSAVFLILDYYLSSTSCRARRYESSNIGCIKLGSHDYVKADMALVTLSPTADAFWRLNPRPPRALTVVASWLMNGSGDAMASSHTL